MARKVPKLKSMTESQVRDYFCILLVQSHLAKMGTDTFQSALFGHTLNFTLETLSQAEAEAKARNIDLAPCHALVMDAFLEGAPDLTPETDPESAA